MPIFRLEGDDLSKAELIIAQETNLELEEHLENWLENSPRALVQEDFLWIGRQTSAADEDGTIFPDLLGIDSEGNLVIVELKRDQAPREVVAQLLEYAAWADGLSESQIRKTAEDYFANREGCQEKTFDDTFTEVFDMPETHEIPPLNQKLRLFIVAEEIPTRVAHVCRFLRTSHGMDISCIDVSTFQTEAGERLVSMETKVGDENAVASKIQSQSNSQTPRGTGDKSVKQVVWEGVEDFIDGNTGIEFFNRGDEKSCLRKAWQILKLSPNVTAEIEARVCELTLGAIDYPQRVLIAFIQDTILDTNRLYDSETDFHLNRMLSRSLMHNSTG